MRYYLSYNIIKMRKAIPKVTHILLHFSAGRLRADCVLHEPVPGPLCFFASQVYLPQIQPSPTPTLTPRVCAVHLKDGLDLVILKPKPNCWKTTVLERVTVRSQGACLTLWVSFVQKELWALGLLPTRDPVIPWYHESLLAGHAHHSESTHS